MKKIFTLFAVILMAVCASAQELAGIYIAPFTTYNSYWGETSDVITSYITVEMVDDTHVSIYNIAAQEDAIVGEVDIQAGTITFENQKLNSSYVMNYNTFESKVVAKIVDGTIVFEHVGLIEDPTNSEKVEWFKEDICTTLTKIEPKGSIQANYVLNNGDNVKGETTLYFFDSTAYDCDYAFKVGKALLLFYKDGENLESLNSALGWALPEAEEYNCLSVSTFTNGYWEGWDWIELPPTQLWKMYGDDSCGCLTFQASLESGAGFWTDTVEEGTFVLSWGSWNVISGVEANRSEQPIYNLAGQRVEKATNGIYIKDGKKIVLKK